MPSSACKNKDYYSRFERELELCVVRGHAVTHTTSLSCRRCFSHLRVPPCLPLSSSPPTSPCSTARSHPVSSLFPYTTLFRSGKSTLLHILATLELPTNGQITLNKQSFEQHHKQIRPNIGFVPQDIALWEEFTVEENMVFF